MRSLCLAFCSSANTEVVIVVDTRGGEREREREREIAKESGNADGSIHSFESNTGIEVDTTRQYFGYAQEIEVDSVFLARVLTLSFIQILFLVGYNERAFSYTSSSKYVFIWKLNWQTFSK